MLRVCPSAIRGLYMAVMQKKGVQISKVSGVVFCSSGLVLGNIGGKYDQTILRGMFS